MKFVPIIHNLTPNMVGYKEIQFYNNLVASRPQGGMLASKLIRLREWEAKCQQALKDAKTAILGESHKRRNSMLQKKKTIARLHKF